MRVRNLHYYPPHHMNVQFLTRDIKELIHIQENGPLTAHRLEECRVLSRLARHRAKVPRIFWIKDLSSQVGSDTPPHPTPPPGPRPRRKNTLQYTPFSRAFGAQSDTIRLVFNHRSRNISTADSRHLFTDTRRVLPQTRVL